MRLSFWLTLKLTGSLGCAPSRVRTMKHCSICVFASLWLPLCWPVGLFGTAERFVTSDPVGLDVSGSPPPLFIFNCFVRILEPVSCSRTLSQKFAHC